MRRPTEAVTASESTHQNPCQTRWHPSGHRTPLPMGNLRGTRKACASAWEQTAVTGSGKWFPLSFLGRNFKNLLSSTCCHLSHTYHSLFLWDKPFPVLFTRNSQNSLFLSQKTSWIQYVFTMISFLRIKTNGYDTFFSLSV